MTLEFTWTYYIVPFFAVVLLITGAIGVLAGTISTTAFWAVLTLSVVAYYVVNRAIASMLILAKLYFNNRK
jgi:hypothetical protein